MSQIFYILLVAQILLGALDNLLHHELTEKLPERTSAKLELALHGAREVTYAIMLAAFAWTAPQGGWTLALIGVVALEIAITLFDFVEEDRTRTLPPFERVLHTILALNFGAILLAAAPTWIEWAQQPTALQPVHHGLLSWFFTLCAIGVAAWAVRDLAASAALFARSEIETIVKPSGRTLLVTGATGFLGEAFVRRRLAAGDSVLVLSRDPKRAAALFGDKVVALADLAALPSGLHLDGIVNLAGAGIANAPWTRARKRRLLQSRLDVTAALEALSARLESKPTVLVNASAVGYYGDRGDEPLNEGSAAGVGFTSELCRRWEDAAAQIHSERKAFLRFGLVFGRDGGAWPKLVLPLALRVAAQFGAGQQWTAWIHKHDALALIDAALTDSRLSGPINAVAPLATRHSEIASGIARAGRAWGLVAAPAWLLRLALGEMAGLFLDSQRVAPNAALAVGFAYRFPDAGSAIRELLGRRASNGHFGSASGQRSTPRSAPSM